MRILFTNGAPALKNIVLLLLPVLAIQNLGKGQNLKLEPIAEYEASLKAFHTQKVQTACVEFQASTKKKWWYYLPTIGYSFGLPSISGGTNQLVTLDQQKQQNRVKLQAIVSQGNLDYQTELHQLRSMYRAVELEREALTSVYTLRDIQKSIYEEADEANQKKQIKPVEYKQALLTYQSAVNNAENLRKQYELKILEVARFARHQFPASEVLPGLDSPELKLSQAASVP